MITLKDIAKMAGVSTSAVCKALKGGYDVSDELKEKVFKLVEEYDYKPNMLARAFRTKRSYNIAAYYAFDGANTIIHNFFTRVLNSFCNKLAVEGYDLTYISSKVNSGKNSVLDHCKMRNFEGILLACVNYEDKHIVELLQGDIPTVSIDNYIGKDVGITSDNYGGIKMLVEYIMENGHKDICFVHGQDGYTTKKRIKAFKDIMLSKGYDVNDNNLIESEYYSSSKTEQIFCELMNRKERPTCIIFPDDFCAATAINLARKMNISVPDDVSIAGFDSAEFSSLFSPKITTIEQDGKMIGKLAAVNIISLIEQNDMPSQEIVVPVSLIKGETIKKIN